MKITIRYGSQMIVADVSSQVYAFLDAARRKEENLLHEQRRHWDGRPLDEKLIVNECLDNKQETPEQWIERQEWIGLIRRTLAACTSVQRERFLMFALDGLSYAEIAALQGCSKYAVRDSILVVRKKFQRILKNRPHESPFSGY